MTRKTRKNCRKQQIDCLEKQKNAKKGTELSCRLKSCKSKMYQSVYGSTTGGNIRSEIPLFY